MLFGIGLLFWCGRNILGWILTIAGALSILAGILANLHIYFRPSSLFNTLVMLVLLVAASAPRTPGGANGSFGLIATQLMRSRGKRTKNARGGSFGERSG